MSQTSVTLGASYALYGGVGDFVTNLEQIAFVQDSDDGKGIDVHFVDGSQVHFDEPAATSLLSILVR